MQRMDAADRPHLEESLEDLYENAPCGYLSCLPDGTIIKINRTLLAWTGYEHDALVGRRKFRDLLTTGYKIFHETHYAPLLHIQGFASEIALDLVCADRRSLPVLINSVQRRDESGRPILVRTTVCDVTDRRSYERELLKARKIAEQSAKAKSDFAAMVSHEIRTPLNAIIATTQLLSMTAPSAAQQRYLRMLRESSDHLAALVNDVLDFSRIEAGVLTLNERTFDVHELVRSTVERLRVKADEKRLSLGAEIDADVPAWVHGDPLKISQVLTNLLGNALKFTSEGSVMVKVAALPLEADTVMLAFRVVDTGMGIKLEQLTRIFEEFAQGHESLDPEYGGTGLGLAISRKLVALYGGKMTVSSAPGEGSTFAFTLTLRRAEAPR